MPGGALVLVEDGDRRRRAGVLSRAGRLRGHRPPGATLLPGLIDTHVHLCGDSGPRALDQLPELSADELDAVIADRRAAAPARRA